MKHTLFSICCGLGLALFLDVPGTQAAEKATGDPVIQTAAALYDDIRSEILPNGLRVYLKPIPSFPVVTTMVAYKVGSADEDLENTGLSHYLEHLMFKGTDKLKPGDIDRFTLRNGGANNAYTTTDYTVYHFDFAADRWEAALDIEADRMRNLRIDAKHEFEQEKGAVIAELERNEDRPWDLEEKTIFPLLFGKKGPYGHPIIGERQHVRGASAAIIKAHYDKWYHPNNAALVVCGGFDADKAMAKIKALFGPIPKGPILERRPVVDSPRKGPVAQEFTSRNSKTPRLLMGFNTCRIGEPDHYALDILQSILAVGKTSRLYKKLVEGEEMATTVGSSNSTGRYPGWFSVEVEVIPDKDRKKAEELVLAELKKLRDEPISARELKRVQRGLLRGAIFSRESAHELADSIARGVTTNDLDFLKTYLPKIAAVTVDDVQRVARKYFDPDKRVAVWSVPRGEQEGKLPSKAPLARSAPRLARLASNAGGPSSPSLKEAQRVVLDNGLTLLLLENHRLPAVVVDTLVDRIRELEPENKAGVAALTGRLLEEGTGKHTGPEIAELIEDAGGDLDLGATGGTVRVLSPDLSLGLGLLVECLTQPIFPKEAFEREKEDLLASLENEEQQPETRAELMFHELVYGKHPYGRSSFGRRESLQALTPADCADFHRRLFVPNNVTIAIVGDFDSKVVAAELKRLTAGWKSRPLPAAKLPEIPKIPKFTQRILSMPEAAQLHFYLGHLGIRRDNPDFFKLLVMDYILGTGPGFTDRLSARLRDRQGLAYTVRAEITSGARQEPGVFSCYIGTPPENFALVKRIFLEELDRIRHEKPKPAEVEDVKKYLLGVLPFQLISNERIAGLLIDTERYKLGLGYLDDYRKAIAAVTPEDVLAVAQKYIDPERMVLVAAGALDENGKALGVGRKQGTR